MNRGFNRILVSHIISLILFLIFSDFLEPTTCEAGWIPWGSSCYSIMLKIPHTWINARDDCQRLHANLMIIDGKNEQDFITDEIANLKINLVRFLLIIFLG